MSELAWVKALPQIRQTQGFSPGKQELRVSPWWGVDNICAGFQIEKSEYVCLSECHGSTCVDAFMPLQSSRVTESSLTVHTDVRFLSTVNPQVSLQIS